MLRWMLTVFLLIFSCLCGGSSLSAAVTDQPAQASKPATEKPAKLPGGAFGQQRLQYGKEFLQAPPPSAQEEAEARAEQERMARGKEILMKNPDRPSMITQAIALSLLSLTPFIIMILSSFLKIVIVLSLLRTALGVAQSPPNPILNGVAFMLSLYVMYPTALAMYKAAETEIAAATGPNSLFDTDSPQYIIGIAQAAREPLRDFLQRNSSVKHQGLFYRMAYRLLPDEMHDKLKSTDFMIVVPAYITSQLKDAFEIGVLIYIPFFVIDLVTSNILLAMGMMMLSPVTISMPLKLFLLVMLDGWTLLIEGLVLTFR